MIVKFEPVVIAEVTRLIDAENDRFCKRRETAQHGCRRYFLEICMPDRAFDRLQDCIFSDSLFSAQHQSVIYFFTWPLHAMCEPPNDMVRVSAEQLLHMRDPEAGFCWVARHDDRTLVQIEACRPFEVDPTAIAHQLVTDELRLAGSPGHLLNGPVFIQPVAGPDQLSVVARYFGKSCIDAGCRPERARGRKEILVRRQVGAKLVEAELRLGRTLFRGKTRTCGRY